MLMGVVIVLNFADFNRLRARTNQLFSNRFRGCLMQKKRQVMA